MTQHDLLSTNLPVIASIIIASMNLLIPFFTKENSSIRNFLLILISGIFLLNILVIDCLFLYGLRINWTLFSVSYYIFAIHLEAVGIVFLNLLGVLWFCALLYSVKYLTINKMVHSTRFLFFFNLTVIIGVLISLAANLFTMFVVYELLTLTTIPLIIHNNNQQTQNGLYQYLRILMSSSMLLFLPAVLIIYTTIHHGNFTYHGFMANNFSTIHSILLFVMFIFGISKAATYPLHGWLPAAMVASYPVSALLHAVVVVKAGLFCIFKIIIYVFGIEYLQSIFSSFNWIILLPIITIFYSALKALQTQNIKMILAYSTINQLAMALLSAFMFTPKAMIAAIIHMVAHAITKICLFFAAGNYYSIYHSYNVSDLLGMKTRMPKTSFLALIAILSLIGIPPFAGFISKFYIMRVAAEQQQIGIMIVIAVSSVLSAFYMTPILTFIYKTNTQQQLSNEENKLPITMLASVIICATIMSCFLGLYQLIAMFLMMYL